MHYWEAADVFADILKRGEEGEVRPRGLVTSVGQVAATLKEFAAEYATGVIPDLRPPLALDLFNTYRSAVFASMFPFALTRHADQRGSFFECVRSFNSGQTSFSTTVPGITRGNHFHFHKVERFLVISGQARISIRKLGSNKPIHYDVDGDRPAFIDMPTLHTHSITNTGSSELLTIFWSHDLFNPETPDTYLEAV